MQIIDITCKTDNVPRPEFQAIVDGVNLESTSLSKMECLISNVYPQSKFHYEFNRKMKYLRKMVKRNGELMFWGQMQILDADYPQQLADIFHSGLSLHLIRVYDIHGDQIADIFRADVKAGKFPPL
ncbi:MAG: hypothetical protein WC052_06235 [Patescibacteria group bacterium]